MLQLEIQIQGWLDFQSEKVALHCGAGRETIRRVEIHCHFDVQQVLHQLETSLRSLGCREASTREGWLDFQNEKEQQKHAHL